jgi:hypothetical protein
MSNFTSQVRPIVFLKRTVAVAVLLEMLKWVTVFVSERNDIALPVLTIPEQMVSQEPPHGIFAWIVMFTAGVLANLLPGAFIAWLWSLALLKRPPKDRTIERD